MDLDHIKTLATYNPARVTSPRHPTVKFKYNTALKLGIVLIRGYEDRDSEPGAQCWAIERDTFKDLLIETLVELHVLEHPEEVRDREQLGWLIKVALSTRTPNKLALLSILFGGGAK